jgi:hypothetical protein
LPYRTLLAWRLSCTYDQAKSAWACSLKSSIGTTRLIRGRGTITQRSPVSVRARPAAFQKASLPIRTVNLPPRILPCRSLKIPPEQSADKLAA